MLRSASVDFTVVITMAVVRMVQMAIDEVIDVIAMRDRFVAAIRPMNVRLVVTAAGVVRSAFGGICRRNVDGVLLDFSVGPLMVQMPVVQVIDMPIMLNCRMAAARTVLMIVLFVHVR